MVVDSSVPIESQTIEAGQVPVVMMELLTGSKFEGGRSAGIFTADDLINILQYVRDAMQLPQSLEQFTKDIGSNSTDIPGLEPQDIIDLYQKITNHAQRWTSVQNLVKEQASALKFGSLRIVDTGDDVIKCIDQMKISEQMRNIKDSTVTIPISEEDTESQQELSEIIQDLREICLKEQERTHKVLTAVRDYKTEISGGTLSNKTTVTGLEPAIADKKNRAKKADLGAEIIKLQEDIDSLEKEINQLGKDYDKYVGLVFTALPAVFVSGGLLVAAFAITGGIFGDQAEKVRKSRNSKLQEQKEKSEALKKKKLVQGILNNFATQFTNIGMRLIDAQKALEHLDFVWNDIIVKIEHSADEWNKVRDSDSLRTFLRKFKKIVEPWKIVGDMSAKLSNVFDQAIDEFKNTYPPIEESKKTYGS